MDKSEYQKRVKQMAEEYVDIRYGNTDMTEPDDPLRVTGEAARRWLEEELMEHEWIDKSIIEPYQILQYSENDEAIDDFYQGNDYWSNNNWRDVARTAARLAFRQAILNKAHKG